LGGEITEGAKRQLQSHGIAVLHVPFAAITGAFEKNGVNLRYLESASNADKWNIIERWNALPSEGLGLIREDVIEAIKPQYAAFMERLRTALNRTVNKIRITPVYGKEVVCASLADALQVMHAHDPFQGTLANLAFIRYEIAIEFTNGDSIVAKFQEKQSAIEF
jgi:hypothetical protein